MKDYYTTVTEVGVPSTIYHFVGCLSLLPTQRLRLYKNRNGAFMCRLVNLILRVQMFTGQAEQHILEGHEQRCILFYLNVILHVKKMAGYGVFRLLWSRNPKRLHPTIPPSGWLDGSLSLHRSHRCLSPSFRTFPGNNARFTLGPEKLQLLFTDRL